MTQTSSIGSILAIDYAYGTSLNQDGGVKNLCESYDNYTSVKAMYPMFVLGKSNSGMLTLRQPSRRFSFLSDIYSKLLESFELC